MSSWHKGQHLESNMNIPAALRHGQSWEYNQIIRADREPIWLQHLTKRSTYSRTAQEHPPLMKGVSFVLAKVKPPCREGAQHQTKTQHWVTEPTAGNSSKAKSKLPNQGWERERLSGQQHRATGRQEDTSACWRGHWEYSHTPAVVTHFNTYYGSPAKPSTWFTGWSFLVWVQAMSSTAEAFTHTGSQCLNVSFSLLIAQTVKWSCSFCSSPEGSESEATEAVELLEQVILQETSCSCPQGLLLPLQQRAFLTRAQTIWGPKPSTSAILVSKQASSSPCACCILQRMW